MFYRLSLDHRGHPDLLKTRPNKFESGKSIKLKKLVKMFVTQKALRAASTMFANRQLKTSRLQMLKVRHFFLLAIIFSKSYSLEFFSMKIILLKAGLLFDNVTNFLSNGHNERLIDLLEILTYQYHYFCRLFRSKNRF